MSFVITAGGTGGHISPALAVAAELKRLGKETVFAGSIGGMEERPVHDAGLEYQAFAAKGFNRQRPWTLLTASLVLARSTAKAQKWLREIRARAVGAFGGYVSVPVGQAAKREGIPLLIHEQNSTMGWANRRLSKYADVIALTYEAAADSLGADAKRRVRLTGNPVRPEFSALSDGRHAACLRKEFRQELGFGGEDLVLLVFGGSQGARHINQAVVEHAPELMKRPGLAVLHLTGRKEYERVKEDLAQRLANTPVKEGLAQGLDCSIASRWRLIDYCDRMPAAFAAADIVLSRAGASSLAELSSAAKPALLVPFPFATADHQRANAESLVAAGAALMVPDAELDSPGFLEALLSLIDSAEKREAMSKAAQQFKGADSAVQVAELLIGIAP